MQQQLEKLSGKKQKQKQIKDEALQAIEDALSGKVSVPSMYSCLKTAKLRHGLKGDNSHSIVNQRFLEPPAVFRLATTVNKDSFKDPTQSLQLRVCAFVLN